MWQSVIKSVLREIEQCALGEDANHLATIFRRKGGGGQGLGSFCREITCQFCEFLVETLALQSFIGFCHQYGRGIDCGEDGELPVAPTGTGRAV